MEDKRNIGKFLGLLSAPLNVDGEMQDISHLNVFGNTDWIDLKSYDKRYWDIGMDMVCEALEAGEERAAKIRGKNGSETNK